jgi:hypothetical protein
MARTRFVLDTSQLDDENVGLDGFSPGFFLNTSTLDSSDKLDGYTFQTNATGSASLGTVSASADADVIVNIQAIGVSELGGLTATATTSVAHGASGLAGLGVMVGSVSAVTVSSAFGSASLGSLSGSVSAVVVHSVSALAGLGAGVGLATSSVLVRPYADGQLGSMVGSAQGTVVPQPPVPPPSYPLGGNPWYRQPKVPVAEKVSVVSVEVESPRVPERIVVSGSSVVSLSASATSEVAWSILEDEAELLLLV